tara:strand:- start:740 stop:1267 length:528 start_codon:yes stop_codon:yes gene_type:complete
VVNKNKAIFFDRDGTLIKTFISKKNKPIAIRKLKDFRLLRNTKKVIKILSTKYKIFVVTNQPDVARGKNLKKNVIDINNKLKSILDIDDVYTSFSENNKNYFRKPNPGMIFLAQKKYHINLNNSYFVGDTDKDIIAGKKGYCKTILLKKKYNKFHESKPDFLVKSFKEILNIIKL